MRQVMKSCLVITSMLIILIPISGASDLASDQSSKITSSVEDGLWVNQTLTINGTTTLNPQSADWVLYDITEPYTEWPVLRSGDFFTTVLPISEGLWNWSLTIDVFGLNCTCWLEIGQPDGLGKEFLNLTKDINLSEYFITSKACVKDMIDDNKIFKLNDIANVGVIVKKAEGEKCSRCWKILGNLCERCNKALKNSS